MKLRTLWNTLRVRQTMVWLVVLMVLLAAAVVTILLDPGVSSGLVAMALLGSLICIELLSARHKKWARPFFTAARAIKRGQHERAEEALDRALAAADRFGKLDPRRGRTLDMLVALYHAELRYDDAEPVARKALALKRQIWPAEHRETVTSIVNLGLVCMGQARFAEALPLLQEALDTLERHDPRAMNRGIALNNLGKWYSDQFRYQESLPYYERAREFFVRGMKPGHEFIGMGFTNVGLIHGRLGNLIEAEALVRNGLTIFRERLPAEHPFIAVVLNNLAEIQGRQGNLEEALANARRGLRIRERVFGPDNLSVASSLTTLAGLHKQEGKYELAETLCRRALRIREDVLPVGHPALVETLEVLADALHHLDSPAQAETYAARARAIRARLLGPEPDGIALAVPATDGTRETAIRAEPAQTSGIKSTS